MELPLKSPKLNKGKDGLGDGGPKGIKGG